MVNVNLLKPGLGGLKNTVVFKFGTSRLQKILFLLSLVFFISGIALSLNTYFQKKDLYQINSQYTEAQKIREKIKGFTDERDRLARGISLLSGYLKREIIWSKKLSQIRYFIPQEAWLARLSFQNKSGKSQDMSLNLIGGFLTAGNTNPIGLLSNFVNQIKSNKEFSADFDNPILTDLWAENREGADIMLFSIEMPLRKE